MGFNKEEQSFQNGESVVGNVGASQEQLLEQVKNSYLLALAIQGYTSSYDHLVCYTRIVDRNKNEAAIVVSQGIREVIEVIEGYEGLADELQTIIPENLIHQRVDSVFGSNFFFYPKLTEQEVELLQTKIEPVDGKIIVMQGEYAVVLPDDPNKDVATFGIGPCRGILIFDKTTGACALGHIDLEGFDDGILQAMRKDLLARGAKPENLVLYGTPNIDPVRQEILAEIYPETHFDRGSSFAFNTATKEVSDSFDAMSFPQTENLDIRIGERDEVRLRYHIPFMRCY